MVSLLGMTEVGVHEAKTRFSELLRLVEAGEEVTVTRGGQPVARLTAVTSEPEPFDRFGLLAGEFGGDDDVWDDDPDMADRFGIPRD